MKRKGYLFEQVVEFRNLRRSALRAARGKYLTTEMAVFLVHLESEVLKLQRELTEGAYCPGKHNIFSIYDRKPRRICAAPFRDRVLHHTVSVVLEPMFERYAIFDSYACRPGKGAHAAIVRAQSWTRAGGYYLKLDIARYFDSVDHQILLALLQRQIKDRRMLGLLGQIIDAAPPHTQPGKGLPIGNLTSQHFANFYLGKLDHFVKGSLQVRKYLRYMDDMVLFSQEKAKLWEFHEQCRAFLEEELALSLNPTRTTIAPISEGLPWLGFRVWPSTLRMTSETKQRFCKKFREGWRAYQGGHEDEDTWLRRASSLLGHILQANTVHFRRSYFEDLHSL